MKKEITETHLQEVLESTKKTMKELGVQEPDLSYITREYLAQFPEIAEPRTPGPTYAGNQIYTIMEGGALMYGFMSDSTGMTGCAIGYPWKVSSQFYNAVPNGTCPINGFTAQYLFEPK